MDLVGGPFAVIESDPGVFTSLTRRLGIRGFELIELYDIEPAAMGDIHPRGLVFCFLWRRDVHRARDFRDPAADRVWFANQLSDNACASLAILNVVFNCPDVELGDEMAMFKRETEKMSPTMKGLAISSSQFIRKAHTSLARPSDIRAALNAIATVTLAKAEETENEAIRRGGSLKRGSKTATSSNSKPGPKPRPRKEEVKSEPPEAYHFIGYVPAHGKIWELDGLKSGPLEVGELGTKDWMDVVRPAIRSKMRKYGGAEAGDNIRFSLLALVDGLYEKASDDFELLKRERASIERRMQRGWESLVRSSCSDQVDPELLEQSKITFDYFVGSVEPARTYSADFGARRMAQDVGILNMPATALVNAWEECVRNARKSRLALEDEVTKATRENTEHLKRTHDYEPFLNEFVKCLDAEGLLDALLDGDDGARKKGKKAKVQ
ncbi:cysteine proteinase [Mycena maculata]|uniref:ubiquitinyl hydrolase 1 n=1 Tax=Mycena maculata TaxID=230809 RepID=A0AAD7I003_9AGAR|nr:cysteine proteinase [Mycena maculata]